MVKSKMIRHLKVVFGPLWPSSEKMMLKCIRDVVSILSGFTEQNASQA